MQTELPQPAFIRGGINWDWFYYRTKEEAETIVEAIKKGGNQVHGMARYAYDGLPIGDSAHPAYGCYAVHAHYYNDVTLPCGGENIR